MYRFARAARISDGPDEVHRASVARQVLRGYEAPADGIPSEQCRRAVSPHVGSSQNCSRRSRRTTDVPARPSRNPPYARRDRGRSGRAAGVGSDCAPAPPHPGSTGRKATYAETNHGRTVGGATLGIQGHGTFSATLGTRAAIEAAIVAAATGLPVTKIAQGGSYTVQRSIAASGRITGTIVATFKARGLGTCARGYVEKPGKFVPGDSFIPMSGTITAIGGTGAAARWHASAGFTQGAVSGVKVEQFSGKGAASGAIGKARSMSKTCKAVAKLPKH